MAVLSNASIGIGGLGALFTLVGVAVFGPVVARPASQVIGAPLPRLRGITGSLARRNAMRNPRRTAGTATALMVGVGVVTLFTVFASSIKASIDDTVAGSVEGELVVGNNVFGGGQSPQLATDISALPEVDHALGLGAGVVLVDGDSKDVSVLDPAATPGALDLDVVDGSITELGAGRGGGVGDGRGRQRLDARHDAARDVRRRPYGRPDRRRDLRRRRHWSATT